MNKLLLENKVVILVGASAGLGKVFAKSFVDEGAKLVMIARNKERLEAYAAELAADGAEVLPISADFKDKDRVKEVFEEVVAKYGTVDALVTNASATCQALSIEATDEEYLDDIVDTDVKGLIRYNREAMKIFLAQDKGVILNIGSNNIGRPICDSIYCAAKYAEWGLTLQLAMRCVATGVRVNLLNPGSFPSATVAVAKEASHFYDADEKVQASGRIPVVNGKMTDVMKARTNRAVPVDLQQVANAAVFLLSDLARDINGQMFNVDRGGYL